MTISGPVGMALFDYAELMDKTRLIDAGAHHIFTDMARLNEEINSFAAKRRDPSSRCSVRMTISGSVRMAISGSVGMTDC